MKAIFFNSPLGTKKLSVTLTEKSVKDLVEADVIPNGSKTLVTDVPDLENLDPDLKLKLMHIEKTYFDNYEKPKQVLIDMEMMVVGFIEALRNTRAVLLNKLDNLQIRASIRGKQKIVDQIEQDKQNLRDFTKFILSHKYTSSEDFRHICPDIFAIDYSEKYEASINS